MSALPPNSGAFVRDGQHLVDGDRRYLDLGAFLDRGDVDGADFVGEEHQRLRDAFVSQCAECEIDVRLDEVNGGFGIEFAGQENAPGQRILQAFHDECRAVGLLPGALLAPHPAMTNADLDRAESGLRHVARRLRTLLIEHNSYLSGGLRYPFPGALPGVAERGLAIYRFPATGEVDVVAEDAAIRITFHAGDLGDITSSGFYLPTLFQGDFSVSADYALGAWGPCDEEAACMALFAQNESSSHRYYAQRMSTGAGPHFVLASMADVLSPTREVESIIGSFRIARRGDEIELWHRGPDEDWIGLGVAAAPAERQMVIGAKIWSKIRCAGLEVRISKLTIEGRLADEQIPLVPEKPDPRSNPASAP